MIHWSQQAIRSRGSVIVKSGVISSLRILPLGSILTAWRWKEVSLWRPVPPIFPPRLWAYHEDRFPNGNSPHDSSWAHAFLGEELPLPQLCINTNQWNKEITPEFYFISLLALYNSTHNSYAVWKEAVCACMLGGLWLHLSLLHVGGQAR